MARMTRRLRRSSNTGQWSSLALVLMIMVILSVLLFLSNYVWTGEVRTAETAVREFYTYEQAGDYGSAYELLHPLLQSRFAKEYYIQHRAHLFMQQLGIRTFRFTLGESERLSEWTMEPGTATLGPVYRVNVTQHVNTVYGVLAINQDVYVVEEQGEWRLLWSYSEP